MPRIRTVKPEFFQHEGLYDAERESGLPLRIAFAGLWTICDKAGRFEWRPRAIKLNVLPYDEVDFSAVLSALEKHGFIRRYVAEGKDYGCIPSWGRHQHINVREPESTIPAPVEAGAERVQVPAQAAGKGRERKGRESGACAPTPDLPDGLNREAWARWLDYRVAIRKPIREVSMAAAAKELASFGAEQAAVVEQSVANSYQGLFALKRTPQTLAAKAASEKAASDEKRWQRLRERGATAGFRDPLPHESCDVYETALRLHERDCRPTRAVDISGLVAAKRLA